jgi:2-phospho-L-lactate guanylyltransferase
VTATLVPFDAIEPKSRLSPPLDAAERRAFAEAMLADVLDALAATDATPTVLATAPVECAAPVEVDERSLSAAVDARLAERDGEPLAVVMADLALVTPDTLERLFAAEGEVVLAPGRGGGTNALVSRHPEFRVDYHGASIRDHRRAAAALGVTPTMVDSFRLATDVDDPADVVEVLLHGEGRARDWLVDAGFQVEVEDGRPGVTRVI